MEKNIIKINQFKKIFDIKKVIETINIYYDENPDIKENLYLINENDLKLLRFIFFYILNSTKYKDINIFFNLNEKKITCKNKIKNNIPNNALHKIQNLIQKFINICLFDNLNLFKFFNISNDNFIVKVLKVIKILFLNNYIDGDNLQNILYFQIILCLYNIKEKTKDKTNNIQNIKRLNLVIDYLISFCSNNNYNMNCNKISQFNKIIQNILDVINKNILTNFNNLCLLSRNKIFYNLIGVSQIVSPSLTSKIIKSLVKVYEHKFNLDFVFDDLSEQFLYKTEKETITDKTKLLIAKNVFLNELFEKEKITLKEEDIFIKNGFCFNDCPNNGIICEPLNKFTHENDGYSIVVSFRLINNINNLTNDKSIFTIFSLTNKDNNNIMNIYIEDCKLKIKLKKEKRANELYEISYNSNYVLWIIQKKDKKHKMIFFLNSCKNMLNNAIYPDGNYKINLGFENLKSENSISKNNFVGLIGTFILFKKCLIKDENDNINITKLTELKGNYEDIIYVKSNKEWGFIDRNLNLILNKLSNDINIYKDIDIIISTKSLGNFNLFYSDDILIGEIRPEFNCNYFQDNYSEKQSKFYFIDKNYIRKNLTYPLQLNNTFINFLNDHGFLYLQLELYYFINILSLQLNDEKNDINSKNVINLNDKQDVYLNISRICSLFFFCIDYLNSNTIMNNSQYFLLKKEVENFKYTLIDLISIYSKYNCKIKIYFLSLFVEKISEKKYFDYCLFILTFEFYDINDNEAFDALFNYLNQVSIDDCDNNQIIKLFEKIIDFDKIYTSNEIKKNTKKEYSKLMRYLIKKSIDEQIEDCFNLYRKRIKKLKEEFVKNNSDDIQEEECNNEFEGRSNRISSDDYNNEGINNANGRTSSKISGNKNTSENDNNSTNEIKNINSIKLLYKYLKNLYIGINGVKKQFIELCNDRKSKICDFFNDLFNDLCRIYPIQNINQISNFSSLEIINAELIKSLCIRFLDDLFFEENIKILEEEKKKQKIDDNSQDEYENKKGSLKNSFNSCKTTVRPNLNNIRLKSSLKKTDSSGNLINSSLNSSHQSSSIFNDYTPLTIEGILTNKMEFFDRIILSPYTFKSFFFMLFRDLSNETKIKIIKNDKNIKTKFLMNDLYFSKTRFLLGVVISLFKKMNSNGYDTYFMTKFETIEYCYNIFIDFLKNMLNNYLESNVGRKKNIKPMINSIFVDKDNIYNVHKLFIIMMEIIFNDSSNNKEKSVSIKEQQLLKKIQKDISEIIDKTLYELVDMFYFKFLREIYIENDINNKYVINTIIMIIEKMITKLIENKKNKVIEINCKNILILIYKIIFYVEKRNLILLPENESFAKKLILFISKFIDNCSIFYTKILFPIEDCNPKNSKRKLLIEIIFEIILEMHLDYLRNPKIESLQVSEFLLKGLFNEERIQTNLLGSIKHKKNSKNKNSKQYETYSPFYVMDKISYFTLNKDIKDNVKISEDITINKGFYDLKDYLLSKYKDEYEEDKNLFSVCIIFSIKIILSIKELNEYYKNKLLKKNDENNIQKIDKSKIIINISNSEDIFIMELRKQFLNLCKNILKIHKENTSLNPFMSIGSHSNNIYEFFRSYIVDKLSFADGDPSYKIQELIESLDDNNNKKLLKLYKRVIYTKEGRVKLYNEKTYNQIMNRKKSDNNLLKETESNSSINDKKSKGSSEERNLKNLSNNLKASFNTVNLTMKSINAYNLGFFSKSQSQVFNFNYALTNTINKEDKTYYISNIEFKKDLIRKYFSFYFNKLLSFDKDFINMKNLYIITYNKEINDIDKYGSLYPSKFKNYISNNYNRIFLKKDFNFFTDGYFKYRHKFLYKNKYKFNYKTKDILLFPLKKLLDENDSANKDISFNSRELIIYECEMLTPKGSIFGNIITFDNCLLFKSELKNDKRKTKPKNKKNDNNINNIYEKDYCLNYACCSIEFDHLNINKKIIIEYNEIKEVINRTFFYSWISLEIFMKNGKSYLFNFFNEETNNDILEFLKGKKVPVIRKVEEYFRKEEFSKKWKEEKISTFDYLLLLNKMSSRTFNDPNQYLIMPWLFLKEGVNFKRNFDLPISVQDKDKQDLFLSNRNNFSINETSPTHGNHYSTSAYIYFYLMRTNPFTNDMIKFQSNDFDIPDRQYTDIKQTIYLCQRMNNNREIIPELFSIPEIYINLNDNDFGLQKDGIRVHNITFEPYAKNAIEFCYLLKNLINYDVEINNTINKWFDFIFGVNQLGNFVSHRDNNYTAKDKENLKILRKFSSYCYGQKYNINKLFLEAKKYNKTDDDLLSDIKEKVSISISFGQCPYQILKERHPYKHLIIDKQENIISLSKYIDDSNSLLSNLNLNNSSIIKNLDLTIQENETIIDIYRMKENGEIIFFKKSINNNYLYCLLNNYNLEIYKFEKKNKYNRYILIKTISPKCQIFSYKRTKNTYLEYNSKFLFCELKENSFIFCRTYDKTLRHINEDNEVSFLLKSYTTCIKRINNEQFITGHDNGKICKWKINYSREDNKIELNLLLMIKSNRNPITCLAFNEKLNIIISCDNNEIMTRKNYDFEYLNSIKIQNKEKLKKEILDIKISDYDFLYVNIYIENSDSYEIQGFTLNGTYFGSYKGNFSDFEITKKGKIIINERHKPIIKILEPVNFNEIYTKEIYVDGINTFFNFHFEMPNIFYYGIKDINSSRIKIIYLLKNEEKHFI